MLENYERIGTKKPAISLETQAGACAVNGPRKAEIDLYCWNKNLNVKNEKPDPTAYRKKIIGQTLA